DTPRSTPNSRSWREARSELSREATTSPMRAATCIYDASIQLLARTAQVPGHLRPLTMSAGVDQFGVDGALPFHELQLLGLCRLGEIVRRLAQHLQAIGDVCDDHLASRGAHRNLGVGLRLPHPREHLGGDIEDRGVTGVNGQLLRPRPGSSM